MKFGYLIYTEFESKRNVFFIDRLISACKNKGLKLILLLSEKINFLIDNNEKKIIYDNDILDLPDFVIQRTMNFNLSFLFESLGVKVFNSSYIGLVADNKYLSYVKMHSINIPILKTILSKKIEIDNLFFPNVTKPINSKGGDRVYLNKNINEYNESIKNYDEDFLIQEPSEIIGKDLRVYVIGKNIIASMLRTSNTGLISNFTKGGSARQYKLDNDEEKIVKKIINEFDFDYVGIDFLLNKKGLVFNEIENVVGARMLYEYTEIDIAEIFIDYIYNYINNNNKYNI